jgi:hypothetical protein
MKGHAMRSPNHRAQGSLYPYLYSTLIAAALFTAGVSCKGSPDETPWCSDTQGVNGAPASAQPTYYRDVKPIFESKCTQCHTDGGLAPFRLGTYEEAQAAKDLIKPAVVERRMPPWLAARCCTDYDRDFSLTEDEIATVVAWVDQGAPGGDPNDAPPPPPPLVGLSRTDLTVMMPEPYSPSPPPGSTDDSRCFVADMPLTRKMFVTGLNPVPGNRSVVHHLIVGVVGPDEADDAVSRQGKDGRPGFDCKGGFGDLRDVQVLGGSLLGGDFPRGIGKAVEPGSKLVFSIHYSTAHAQPGPDQTAVQIRLDETAVESNGLFIANPAWIAGSAMSISAGEKDATFFYRFTPSLYTKGEPIYLQSVTPHMHYFATRTLVRIIRANGERECLLEIPRWDFGWEQPFWFAQPKRLEPDDELYLECHFDNSAENQPDGMPPRDIAWGGDNQDMCAAFIGYTAVK